MKKNILILFLLLSVISFSKLIGAKDALNSKTLSINEMLTYAIQDEYLAKNEYLATLKKFEDVKPFSNIVKSEEQHIAMLLPLIEKYGIAAVDEKELIKKIQVASSLKEAAQTCVDAEIDNIAMYEKFLLTKELPDDIRDAF